MTQTYFKTVMLGLDDWGAALLLNRNDMCISAACGLVRRGPVSFAPLRLAGWQLQFLKVVGDALDYFWPGHCEGAIQGDLNRANSSIMLLTGIKTTCHSATTAQAQPALQSSVTKDQPPPL